MYIGPCNNTYMDGYWYMKLGKNRRKMEEQAEIVELDTRTSRGRYTSQFCGLYCRDLVYRHLECCTVLLLFHYI